MKILLIDNNTVHKTNLLENLANHQVEIQIYKPGMKFHDADKDLVILSGGGGEGQEIADSYNKEGLWYKDEIDFVKTTTKPVLGICMGFEVICYAFGASVNQMDKTIHGVKQIKTTSLGQKLFNNKVLKQFEAHKWSVKLPPTNFDVLAESATGV